MDGARHSQRELKPRGRGEAMTHEEGCGRCVKRGSNVYYLKICTELL